MHKQRYAKIMHSKSIQRNRTKTKKVTTGNELSLEIAADNASEFSRIVIKSVEVEGTPKNVVRTGWMSWNICDASYDHVRKKELEFVHV